MKFKPIYCSLLFVYVSTSLSQQRPIHTFSIVARDSITGEIGVAVQSHWFSVGSIVTWAEAGVGAVATQSFADPSYGPLGLDMMHADKSAKQVLDGLLASDPGRDIRQVAMIDAKGNVAALDAAQEVGGDIRGKQSAAILIVGATSTGRPWNDRIMDLRVEDSPEPLKELRRLVNIHRAYQHENAGDLAVEKNDVEGALREYETAEKMIPDNLEMKFWHAVALVNIGKPDESIPIFKQVFKIDSNWVDLILRLPAVDLLKIDDEGLKKIITLSNKKK